MPPPDFDALLADTNFVRRLAGALVRDPDVADDLAQEALVVALERPPRDGRNLRGWMASVVRSRALERARQASARPRIEPLATAPSPVPTPDEIAARLDTSRRVAEAVRELEEPYRTTIYLRYVEECETRVVAERLGIPLTTAKTRLRRGLELLRQRLDREYGTREAWSALLLPLIPSPTSTTLVTGIFAMSAALKLACSLAACAAIAWLVWPERTRAAQDTLATAAPVEETELAYPGASQTGRTAAAQDASSPLALVDEVIPADAPYALVLDERRFPVAGAHVRLLARGIGHEERITDANGRARFALGAELNANRSRGSLLAWDDSGRAAVGDWRMRSQAQASIGDREKRALGVLVLAPGGSLVVRVADENGPAAGVSIALELGARRSIALGAVTGADGTARFEHLPSLAATIIATRPGKCARAATVTAVGRETHVALRLERAREVLVRVVDVDTKQPVPNAKLSLTETIRMTTDDYEMGPPGRTSNMIVPLDLEIPVTDATGHSRITGLAIGAEAGVRAEAEGFAAPDRMGSSGRIAETADAVTLELKPLHRRTVRWPLEAGEVGAPAEGTVLALRLEYLPEPRFETKPTPPPSARIENGEIVADGIVDGLGTLLATSPDGSIARLWIEEGKSVGKASSFRRARSVEVAVLDASGNPAADVEIDLCSTGNNRLFPAQRTDANGTTVFHGLWGWRVSAQILRRPIGSVDLETGSGRIEARLENKSERECTVRLLVDGVVRLPPTYRILAGPGSGVIAEDPATGIVRVKVAAPEDAQTVDVSVNALGYQPAKATAALDGSTIADLELVSACRLSANVTLPRSGKVRIRAERFDAEKNDWKMGPDGNVNDERYTPNAPDGRFLFSELLPGRYRVRDVVSKRVSESVDLLAAGSTAELILDLSDIVRVQGIVDLPSGLAPNMARVMIDGEGLVENNWDWLGNRRALGGQYVGKDGAFEVFVSTSKSVTLRAWHPWLTPDAKHGRYSVRGEAEDVRLKLVQRDEVRLPFREWYEKQAPYSLRVYAYRAEPSGEPDHVLEAAVDEGIARFSGLPRGKWTLWIDPERTFAPIIVRGVEFGPGVTQVEAKPTRGSSIRVRVLHEGARAPRIYIYAERKSEPTLRRDLNSQREALVTLSGLDAGTFDVHVSAGMGTRLLERTIELDGVSDIEFEVDARAIKD